MNAGIPDAAIAFDDSRAYEWSHRLEIEVPTDSGVRPVQVRAHLSLQDVARSRGEVVSTPTRDHEPQKWVDATLFVRVNRTELIVLEKRDAVREAVTDLMLPVFDNLCARQDGKVHRDVLEGRYHTHVQQRWNLERVDVPTVESNVFRKMFFTPVVLMSYADVSGDAANPKIVGNIWLWGLNDVGGENARFEYEMKSGIIVPRYHREIPEWLMPYALSAIADGIQDHQVKNSALISVD